jgi:hypothetical protein
MAHDALDCRRSLLATSRGKDTAIAIAGRHDGNLLTGRQIRYRFGWRSWRAAARMIEKTQGVPIGTWCVEC